MASLQHLPLELKLTVYGYVDHPYDLHSLISASPELLHAFIPNRIRILSSLLKAAILPGALRHAVFASQEVDRGLSGDLVFESTVNLLGGYFSPETVVNFPTDMPGLARLSRLYSQVSRFIDGYVCQAARRLFGDDDPLWNDPAGRNPEGFEPLSSNERTRLQRAFFRHELYSRQLNRYPHGPYIYDSYTQYDLFIRRLLAWEVEEMSCVYYYFAFLAGGAFDDLEDQVVRAVTRAPGASKMDDSEPLVLEPVVRCKECQPPSDDVLGDGLESVRAAEEDGGCRDGGDDQMVRFDKLHLYDLDLFNREDESGEILSPGETIPYLISRMAATDVASMTRLVRADANERKNMLMGGLFLLGGASLPEAIECAVNLRLYEGARRVTEGWVGDDPSDYTLGYHLFKASRSFFDFYHAISGTYTAMKYRPHREMGYLFWDAERIEHPMVKEALERPHDRAWVKAQMEKRSRFGKSVEQRVERFKLPRREMAKIAAEFGGFTIPHECEEWS